MMITGTSGDDDLTGTSDADLFNLSQGGDDHAKGKGGNDTFGLGGALNAGDRLDGGAGFDQLLLSGAPAIVFGAHTITGIESIFVDGEYSYDFTFNDANIAAGHRLDIHADAFVAGTTLTVHGEAETDGAFDIVAGPGEDTLVTGAGDDVIDAGDGDDFIGAGTGADTLFGGDGGDTFYFDGTGAFDNHDRIDGGIPGAQVDAVILAGDYSAGLTIKHDTLTNIQRIGVLGDDHYVLDIRHMNLTGLSGFTVNGANLSNLGSLEVNGTGIVGVQLNLAGGFGDDVFTGGEDYDSITGNGGVDRMAGMGGPDAFYYFAVSDSTGKKYDTVVGFDARDDFFYPSLPEDDPFDLHTVAVDHKVSGGTLSTATFNGDLAAAIGADELDVAHAVLFAPDAGSLAGELFLVIEGNDVAGYQANADIVVHFEGARHMSGFDISNFGNAG